MYLLDTNVISELRRPKPHGAVLAWIASIPEHELTVPAVCVGEIQIGIERTAGLDPQKAKEISEWLDALVASSQVAPAGAEIFRIWAKLVVRAQSALLVDALIAATAIHGQMTVATRNLRDFEPFGVPCFDPFGFKGPAESA